MKVKHLKQGTSYSCSAASFSMITGKPEAESMKLCKTKKSGTNTDNVKVAFDQISFSYSEICVNQSYKNLWWIKNLSYHFPIYASCLFISNLGRGRNSNRHHAVIFAHGKIFDPSEQFEVEFDCYEHTFDRDLIVKRMLVIDRELEDYGIARREYI